MPIIPVHIDRATASIFSPMQHEPAARADPAARHGLVRLAACRHDARSAEIRRADRPSSTARPGRIARTTAGRSITSSSARPGGIPFRLALADVTTPEVSLDRHAGRRDRPGAGAEAAMARPSRMSASCCRPAWRRAREPGGDDLRSGRRQPQLHRRPGRDGLGREAGRACARSSPAGPSSKRRRSSCPKGSSRSGSRRSATRSARSTALPALILAWLAPIRLLERRLGASRSDHGRRHGHVIFSSGSTGRSQGRGPLSLQHRFQRRGDRPGLPDPSRRPDARRPAAVPLVRLPRLLAGDASAGWP